MLMLVIAGLGREAHPVCNGTGNSLESGKIEKWLTYMSIQLMKLLVGRPAQVHLDAEPGTCVHRGCDMSYVFVLLTCPFA